MLIFLLGPDGFLARNALAKLRTELDPDGMNTDFIDGRAASVDEIARIVNTPAFFGGARTVIIDGFLERLSRAKTTEVSAAPPARAKGQDDVSRLIASLPSGPNILFFDRAAGALPPSVKKAIPAGASVVTHPPPRGSELIAWMRSKAQAGGAQLPDQLARKIAGALYPKTWTNAPANPLYDAPPELERLAHEIEKLTLAAHPGAITSELVDDMIIGSTEDRLFPLIEAIYASELKNAADDLAAARDRGDDPSRIVNSLHQQAELAAAIAPGHDPVQIGQELGLSNPNRMYGVSKSSQRSRTPAGEWLRRLIESERSIKTGRLRDPWDPLYSALDRES